ncbi:hypothetical protein JZ751_000994 [Albula glossodonta]|uniref:Uncharacterized protein n=1 Tax=Albula glossodonta TaxID=121402 RepID=A0A8T2PXT2_9TELE|nr:hypothetical protein JZ751_000994 [Albula glossodonta]
MTDRASASTACVSSHSVRKAIDLPTLHRDTSAPKDTSYFVRCPCQNDFFMLSFYAMVCQAKLCPVRERQHREREGEGGKQREGEGKQKERGEGGREKEKDEKGERERETSWLRAEQWGEAHQRPGAWRPFCFQVAVRHTEEAAPIWTGATKSLTSAQHPPPLMSINLVSEMPPACHTLRH